MGSESKYLIAMEINLRKDDNSMIDGNDSEGAFASPLRIEAYWNGIYVAHVTDTFPLKFGFKISKSFTGNQIASHSQGSVQ